MKKQWMAAMTVALATAMSVGCAQEQQAGMDGARPRAAAKAEPVPVLNQVRGSDEALQEPGVRLLTTAAAAEQAGVSHVAEGLGVNWDEQSLVLLTLGQQPTAGYWAQIRGVQQVGDVLYVEGTANRPAEDAALAQVVTYPYAAAVIRNTGATRALISVESVVGQETPGDAAGGAMGNDAQGGGGGAAGMDQGTEPNDESEDASGGAEDGSPMGE